LQSWFVDFDPVRAKLDVRQAAGLEPATAALFANEFEDSELGHIPKGWDIRSLDKIAHYLNGVALQKYPPGDGPGALNQHLLKVTSPEFPKWFYYLWTLYHLMTSASLPRPKRRPWVTFNAAIFQPRKS
jgi:type I restriction enzyme S subunit